MDTQRLILFIVFSFSLLLLWQEWEKQHQPATVATATSTQQSSQNGPPIPSANLSPTASPAVQVAQESASFQQGQRIQVTTDMLEAVLDTAGGDIRRLALLKHQISEDGKKENLVLLDDKAPHYYALQSGLIGDDLPNHKSMFTSTANAYTMANGQNTLSVTLTWKGSNGMTVDKIFTFHRGSYLVDTAFKVHNGSGAPITPSAYFQLVRDSTPPSGEPRFVKTYTGPAMYTDAGKFQKIPFTDIEKGKANFVKTANNGWVSMLQHYFLTAILPPDSLSREFYMKQLGNGLFSAGVIMPMTTAAPGSDVSLDVPVYAGPQEQEALKKLAPGLDLTVDYGMLTVIATPLFWFLSLIHKLVDNWGVAIILLTILVKGAFYPLSAKSYKSMAQMRVLSPKLKRLKETYGDDRQKLHQAMMDLYKTEKINPLGGCLPVVVQIPVFISLYWVLLYSVELRQAPFALWIHDLSAPDPFYVLPIIMGISMILQTRLNPTPPDPIQAKVMMVMPVAFSVFFLFFPSGLVLYWLVNNIISIIQQTLINRSIEHAKAAKGSSKR